MASHDLSVLHHLHATVTSTVLYLSIHLFSPPPHFVACIWVLTYSRESNSQWSLLAYLAEHLGFGVLRDVVGDLKVA